jgi:MoaA/NifB/PqqE/SkfB family radical SAM enzyme
MTSAVRLVKRQLGLSSDRIYALPVVVLMPHSACNCRCVMCDIWLANRNKRELSTDDLMSHMPALRALGTHHVVLSGGEALMHSNLWALCELLREAAVTRITVLSTGLLLERNASKVVRHCDEVTVSLDGSREVHDRIRNIPNAFDRLAAGVRAVKRQAPSFRVTARAVIQRLNYFDLPNIIESARALGIDQVSFFAVDVSSAAFNRSQGWAPERVSEVALTRDEVTRFGDVVEETIKAYPDEFASGFVAESPAKLRRLPRYFAALNGDGAFPENHCNAPWVSAVVEADGTVRPCFFHRSLGNIRDGRLDDLLNSDEARSFRGGLDIRRDPICQRCVCTLYLAPGAN